jgi:hypothetical protein
MGFEIAKKMGGEGKSTIFMSIVQAISSDGFFLHRKKLNQLYVTQTARICIFH